MTVRTARVFTHGNITPEVVAAYLPNNYKVIATKVLEDDDDSRPIGTVTISGTDNHGWTLDGYVIPRLASGMIVATETTNTEGK